MAASDPLRDVAREWQRYDAQRDRFVAAVRAAYEAGYSLRQIAEVTGYSHGGIRKLLD